MKKVLSVLLFISLCNNTINVAAYDDELTHPQITESSVTKSLLKSKKYLSVNLGEGFSNDYDSIVNGKKVIEWLMDGATDEDDPHCRAASHFHNPLKFWDESALSDTNETLTGVGINLRCFIGAYSDRYSIHKYSNLTWATGYTSPTSVDSDTGNDYDWNAARNNFKLALTGQSSAERENAFANTFLMLGQVVHLIQDMSVPAHTRNDLSAHLVFKEFKGFDPARWGGNGYEWFVKNNPDLITNAEASAANTSNGLLTGFWDTNQYNGSNLSESMAQGLAEYTNSNFFSKFTIFAEEKNTNDVHYFPRPSKNETYAELIELIAEDGQTDHSWYVKKIASNYKLASYSFVEKWVKNKIEDDGTEPYDTSVLEKGWKYNLDDEVFKDYAKQLLPRAVGYSAGLINYFFRGGIDMVKDDANPRKYIIENHSSEAMDGICTLYYDDENDNRIEVTDARWTCNIAANSQIEVESFTALTDPKPKKKGEYMLVYEGKLGNEENVSVGKVVKFDTIPSARAVSISVKRDYGYITVLTDGGKITGRLSSEGLYGVVAVRFDQNDWNTFFVLAKYFDCGDGKSCYKYHKYSIDESTMTLIYHGVPVKDVLTIKRETSEEILHEDGGRYYKLQTHKNTYEESLNIVSDFSVNDGVIKPFGMIYSESSSGIGVAECQLINSNDWSCWDAYSVGYLNSVSTQKLYYGPVIQESTVNNCTGGSYDSTRHFEECKNGPVEPRLNPVAIFNSDDYAYMYGSKLVSTLKVEMPPYLAWPNYSIWTMMRESGKYSYFTYMKRKAYLSFSSEIGVVECDNMFMTDIKDGENYIGWRKGYTISFNSCSDWTKLKGASINTSSEYLFDVIFQKE